MPQSTHGTTFAVTYTVYSQQTYAYEVKARTEHEAEETAAAQLNNLDGGTYPGQRQHGDIRLEIDAVHRIFGPHMP